MFLDISSHSKIPSTHQIGHLGRSAKFYFVCMELHKKVRSEQLVMLFQCTPGLRLITQELEFSQNDKWRKRSNQKGVKTLSLSENSQSSCLIGCKYFINSEQDFVVFLSFLFGWKYFNNSKQLFGFFS